MVSAADELVANLTAQLKARRLWPNTVFVFGSDVRRPDPPAACTAVQRRSTFKNCARRQNGGDPFVGSNFPWKGGKATLFEGGVRTPSFVYSELLPPSVRGTNVTHPTHIADFYATFCNLAGIDPQDTRPGACRKPAPPAHLLARGMRARARVGYRGLAGGVS